MEKIILDKSKYPPESAGRRMIENVPLAHLEETIFDIKKQLFEKIQTLETINYIYVVDKDRKLVGVFSIKEIFRRPEKTKIKEIMKTKIVKVRPYTDQERVAILALRHNLKSIPVVDKDEKFLGVVPSDIILDILHSEHIEDILRFIGIRKVNEYSPREYFKIPIKTSIKARIPWLIIGLLGGAFAAQVISFFEGVLETKIILAAFTPLITYMADAIGTQTETIFVRGVAIDPRMSAKKFLFRELKIGLAVALICGFLISIYSLARFQSPYLGIVLSLSLFLATLFAILIGTFIPFLINKFKKDPALGTGPLTTILQDVASVATYFIIASLLLKLF